MIGFADIGNGAFAPMLKRVTERDTLAGLVQS